MIALVSGGGGFLGEAIVQKLIARGDIVRSISRSKYPKLERLGVTCFQADLSKEPDLSKILQDVDVVFHVAAKAGIWGKRETFFAANMLATKHILAAAQIAKVRRFIYTSSPSVTFEANDQEGVCEKECFYPEEYLSFYSETKALAEQAVLKANSATFATTALRPHLIWGPNDPHLLPRLIARQREGKLRRVGKGENKVAITHVQNAANAHILAADALKSHSVNAGKAYFITDGEPVLLWDWITCVCVSVGLDPVLKTISSTTAYRAGAMLEWIWRTFNYKGEPPMTRFVAAQLSTSHWFDISAAKRDFGYEPTVDLDKAMKEMLQIINQT